MKRLRTNNREKFQRLTFLRNLQTAAEIFKKLESENISPVLIKGFAAAINYPRPFQRAFSDIDLAVDPKHFIKASEIISKNNFVVDLHRGLRHLDTMDWEKLFAGARFYEIEGEKFRFLRSEDHLRVLCVHWLNDGGADRTRLWDIYFALAADGREFDWRRFLNPADEKRRIWLVCVILIVMEYLGLELEEAEFDFSDYKLPRWVKEEIEKEWKNDTRLIPLERVFGDSRELYKQMLKRIPPNALQAVVETESEIGNSKSYLPLIDDFFKRAKPSVKRILKIGKEN